MKNKICAILAFGLLVSNGVGAVPVTVDFTGQGNLCTWPGVQTTYLPEPHCTNNVSKSFTGSVVFDVIGASPFGPDSGTDGSTYAYDHQGWVKSYFFIQWDGGSFSPNGFPGMSQVDSLAQVTNDAGAYDSITVRDSYSGTVGGKFINSSAEMLRMTSDISWLTNLSFDPLAGLAPNGLNFIDFSNYSGYWVEGGSGEDWVFTGYEGRVNLASLSVRPTEVWVPEPGTLALLGFGLIGIGFARRRASSN